MVALVWRMLALATGFAIRLWRMANAFAKGECGVFANSKRIGNGKGGAFATGLADFNAEANGKHIRICRWQSRQMQRLGGF